MVTYGLQILGVPLGTVFHIDKYLLQGGAGVTAGLLISEGRIEWFSTPGHRCSDIATLETLAGLEAFRLWHPRLRRHGVMILSDNAVTLAGLARGLSANYGVNECVKAILRLFTVCDIQPTLIYIPSALNPADPLTRDFIFSVEHDDVVSTLRHWSTLGVPGGVELVRFFGGSNLPVFRWV